VRRTLGIAPILGLFILSHSPAAGQPAAPNTPAEGAENPAGAQNQGLVPPKLKRAAEVSYPEIEGEPHPASVLLVITIGADGSVSNPELVEGAGEPFDSRALELITSFEFEPALQRGEPVPARIQYRLVFTPPEPEPEPAAAPPPVTAAAAPAAAAPATAPEPTAEPAAAPMEESFEAVADVEAPPREPTRRAIEEEQLTRIPGTRGDALRAVEVLPGVGRTGFAENEGPPIIRGAQPYESMVTLDGAPIPLLYHFGGLTSVYNSHLLEQVELYPGNFSARYGRVVGGVVEAKTRDPRTDGFHGILELSLIDNFVLVEAPITDKTSFALAGRRSNIDFVFD